MDNDGNIDILIVNMDGPPTLLMNRGESANHGATFQLIGTRSNKSGIGARVKVTAGPLVQFDEVRGGGSYLSQNDPRLHFGLEQHAVMDRVEISWPSGGARRVDGAAGGFYLQDYGRERGLRGRRPFVISDRATPQVRTSIKQSATSDHFLIAGSAAEAPGGGSFTVF